jgi:hypothetical protein
VTSKRVTGRQPPHRRQHLSCFGTSITVHACIAKAMNFRCNKHAVVLKSLHELYVLVAAGTDSRVHLLRILAQRRAYDGAYRPPSVTLESVSTCHPSCTGLCMRLGNDPVHSQRQLATAVQPVAARISTAACATIFNQNFPRLAASRSQGKRPKTSALVRVMGSGTFTPSLPVMPWCSNWKFQPLMVELRKGPP